jgi:hypothetical protein
MSPPDLNLPNDVEMLKAMVLAMAEKAARADALESEVADLKACNADGRVCLSNNTAERALRGIALDRKSWLFCRSDRGRHRAAAMYSLIVSAMMNDVAPQAWLADVLARIATHPTHRLDELLPWNWKTAQQQGLAAQAA